MTFRGMTRRWKVFPPDGDNDARGGREEKRDLCGGMKMKEVKGAIRGAPKSIVNAPFP